MIFANYHTHTTFCDGRDTPEQIVQEAIRLGCPAIGFSGHSVAPYDYAGMTPEHEAQYRAEVHRLQAAYAGQIQILCGVEQDYWSDAATDGYDYVIGGVHYLRHGNEFRSVDGTPDILRSIVNDWYGGDWYAMAEEYYGLIGNLYEKTRCRVIAHFDLIEKFNEDGSLTARSNKIITHTPLRRFGVPEDLTGALLFLCDESQSGFITGVILPVDGGFSAYSGV